MAFFVVDLQRECMINYRQCITLRNNSFRKEHLRVLLHWWASIAGLPCSPPTHRNITLMGSPRMRWKVILGKGSDTKLLNLRLIQKPGAKSRMLLLSATTQHPVNVAEYLAEQILPKLQNFHYHCNFHLFIVF